MLYEDARMPRRLILALVTSVIASTFVPSPASAGFTLCNYAPWPVFVSLAYNDTDKGWVSIGWWEVRREECSELVAGSLQGRKIYGVAAGRSHNGTIWWWGDVNDRNNEKLCTPPYPSGEATHFTINHNEIRDGCKNAGYQERGFWVMGGSGDQADRRQNLIHTSHMPVEDARLQKPKDRFWECGGCPEMIVIPAGEFTMGSPDHEPERRAEEGPRHKVKVDRFAVSKGAVTRDQFDKFVNATGHKVGDACLTRKDGKWSAEQGRSYKDPGFAQGGNHPAVCVNFEDIKAYLTWLSKQAGEPYRLLSEAEWEYVARAGSDTPFWWGSTITPAQANYNGNIAFAGGAKGEFRQKTVPAFEPEPSFKLNPSNLFIGEGNVSEWVEDCWNKNYQGAPSDGSVWSKGDCNSHVVRGGSWASDPALLRSAARQAVQSSTRSSDIGFRVARPMAPYAGPQ